MSSNIATSAQHDLIGFASEKPTVGHTMHPDAQWFGEAGLGLFIHWGLSSVEGKCDISWGMMRDTPWDFSIYENINKVRPTEYYKQAERFDPEAYDPDLWMAAAANAGMKYVVLTTKHHEGYALWPSKYGELSTRTYMHGRDLLRPYVDACRRHGLKVGFYYSPPDWYYCRNYMSWGYSKDTFLDMNWQPGERKIPDETFVRELNSYIRGQVTELLTQYGQIDLIWFDGHPNYEMTDENGKVIPPISIEEIRKLQPGIVINPRLHDVADFLTPECAFPEKKPEGWWEGCYIWNDCGWGYTSNETYKPLDWMLNLLAKHRAWDGNLLINCAPRADGRLPENCYRRLEELAQWMKPHKEAIFGVKGGLYPEQCTVPATHSENVWYLFLTEHQYTAVVHGRKEMPKSATLLKDGSKVEFRVRENGDIAFITNLNQITGDLAVIRVEW